MNWFNPSTPKSSADLKAASDQIKTWVRESLSLSDDDAVTVSEVNCRDPACSGVETAILVMKVGAATRMLRISKPLIEIRRGDFEAALD
jgi:hypothetical protein